jgi:hypothetical protein
MGSLVMGKCGVSPLPLFSTTGSPGEQRIGRDHRDDNQHPILALEAQKSEGFNEKLHDACLIQAQHKPFAEKNILFLYYSGRGVFGAAAGPDEASLSKSDG